ncbi:MAG: hypothetical protein EOO93_00955 [Pedobacter sp.]|nr:MAG: hypothetical protein EOO93_00955 [Pedobacter sp.]
MTIGKLIYNTIFKPTSSFRYNINHFGLFGYIRILMGETKMKKAALSLPSIELRDDFDLEVNFLTGSKYWHQTIFCGYTLATTLQNKVKINFYSDGTLSLKHIGRIQSILKKSNFISEAKVVENLLETLPQANFPVLHSLRKWHPFFRRLIDIHINQEWALHLDSDMLFFSKPYELIHAFKNKNALYMKELMDNSYYADSEKNLEEKYDIICSKNVNGGIVAYNGTEINYQDLELKAKILLQNYPNAGAAQIEQTLMGYILNEQNAVPLDDNFYQIIYEDTFF